MIQILGLRDTPKRPGESYSKPTERFFANKWRAANVEEVLSDPAKILKDVPRDQLYNLFFTLADCFEEPGRRLKEQWVIPFDIDGIQLAHEEIEVTAPKIVREACIALGLDESKTGALFSGNGVWLYIKIPTPIQSADYFKTTRPNYKELCKRVYARLTEKGLAGENLKVDSAVFDGARLSRMPLTMNKKPGKPERMAVVLQARLEPQDFDIVALSGLTSFTGPEHVSKYSMRFATAIDTEAVLEGCGFLKHANERQETLSEDAWYAMLSVTSWLADGNRRCHDMSSRHPKYSTYETDLKIEQARDSAGPRTCKDISGRWDGCERCPHFGKVTSPIRIRGPNFIKTKDTGFRETPLDKDGKPKTGKVAYEDLILQFTEDHPFVYIEGQDRIYVYNEKHWEHLSDGTIKEWVRKLVCQVRPAAGDVEEFIRRLKMNNVRSVDWLINSSAGFLNFQNGVLNLMTKEILPHDMEYGFTWILPYAYDAKALCPTWDKFMLDITVGDVEVAQLLEEFAGYCVSGAPYRAHKALLLLGSGANGKSVFLETLGKVVGDKNRATISMTDLNNEQHRSRLVNKLFNYSEETNKNSIRDRTEIFKTLASGGPVSAKDVYKEPFEFHNRAKFILSANTDLNITDASDGMFRRLIVVRLTAQFKGKDDDKYLKDKLEKELPGICNRLMEAHARLSKNGYTFTIPTSIQENLDTMRTSSNIVFTFLNERVVVTKNTEDKVTTAELFAACNTMAMERNEKMYTMREFAIDFAHRLGKDFQPKLLRFGDKVARGYTGLKLLKDTEGEIDV